MLKTADILIVCKQSRQELCKAQVTLAQIPKARRSIVKEAHEANRVAREAVQRCLKARKLKYRVVFRSELARIKDTRLVVAVGGDGTILDTARRIQQTPLVGVNSSPSTSEGFFAAVDAGHFPKVLDAILSDRVQPLNLARLCVRRNNRMIGFPVLNDILITHRVPVCMSHYQLIFRGQDERHRGSGLWIAPAAGSTGAIHSAGGKILRMDDPRFQFVVREPYKGALLGSVSTSGILKPEEQLECISAMPEGCIYLDGHPRRYRFDEGDHLCIGLSRWPLRIYGLEPAKGRQFACTPKKDKALNL